MQDLKGEDNSWRSRETLRPRGKFFPAGGLSHGIGPAPGAERLRISGYGHSFHWGLGLVPRFRAFGCRRSAYDRYGGADFNIILDQHIAWSATWATGGSNGTGYCCLLPRASALWGDGCSGGWDSFSTRQERNTQPFSNARCVLPLWR